MLAITEATSFKLVEKFTRITKFFRGLSILKSRYDNMTESKYCYDKVTLEKYPDPLSTRFDDIQFTKVAEIMEVTKSDLKKFWYFFYNTYGMVENDDIFLGINNVPYLGFLEEGDILFIVDVNDMLNYHTQKTRDV